MVLFTMFGTVHRQVFQAKMVKVVEVEVLSIEEAVMPVVLVNSKPQLVLSL